MTNCDWYAQTDHRSYFPTLLTFFFMSDMSCGDTRSFDASGASFLCFRPELLYVSCNTAWYAELRSPFVLVVDDDHGNDSDADDQDQGRGQEDVSLHKMQQRFQSQGRSDLSSEKWVWPGATIQLPILCLSCWARFKCASTREEMPSRSGRVCDRPGQAAETRPLRSGVHPKNRRHPLPRRTTIHEDQKHQMAPWNTTPNIVWRSSTRRSDTTGKNGRNSEDLTSFWFGIVRDYTKNTVKCARANYIMWTRICLFFFSGIQDILGVRPTIFTSLSRPEELNCEDRR